MVQYDDVVWVKVPDVDTPGHDLGRVDDVGEFECLELCADNSRCTSVLYGPFEDVMSCWPKEASLDVGNIIVWPGFTYYEKVGHYD